MDKEVIEELPQTPIPSSYSLLTSNIFSTGLCKSVIINAEDTSTAQVSETLHFND
jgi:hypothetical protein